MSGILNTTNRIATLSLGIFLGSLSPPSFASEQQELLQLKNTVVNLVDALVKQGVLNPQQAAALIKKAEQDAVRQTAQALASAPATAVVAAAAVAAGDTNNVARAADGKQVVRVPYVPEFVKDEMRSQLRAELRQDVLADVADKAKKEKWGTPDALPAWLNTVKLYGDVRVRNQYDAYGSENAETLGGNNAYLNILEVNKAGGIAQAGNKAFLNTSENEDRWRERVRLGLTAKIANRWTLDTRLVTGNFANPVSTNVTLGNTEQRFNVALDRAQLRYDRADEQGFNWVTASAGRIPNPWLSTELVWDEDVSFDGVAATFRQPITLGNGDLLEPVSRNRKAYLTTGIFPLQEPAYLSQDRYLVGGQLGADWEFENQNLLKMGAAVYDYIHIAAKRNTLGSTLTNDTAPQFLQKGNLLFNIANDPNLDGSEANQLYGLAADYRVLDFIAVMDFANLAPHHVTLQANIVKNIGFDDSEILQRTGGETYLYPIKDRTLGLLGGVLVGWPDIARHGAWQMNFDYRYLQRDAVLDAFTDSDFHLGGTDTQGYRISGLYGLTRNVWLRARWISATEIDGPPLAIDVLQIDLNAKF